MGGLWSWLKWQLMMMLRKLSWIHCRKVRDVVSLVNLINSIIQLKFCDNLFYEFKLKGFLAFCGTRKAKKIFTKFTKLTTISKAHIFSRNFSHYLFWQFHMISLKLKFIPKCTTSVSSEFHRETEPAAFSILCYLLLAVQQFCSLTVTLIISRFIESLLYFFPLRSRTEY